METITTYLNIAGTYINMNFDFILLSLFSLLFLLLMILDLQFFNKLIKKNREIRNKIHILEIQNMMSSGAIEYLQDNVEELKKENKKLKNQKKSEKYYLEKRFLALDLAIMQMFRNTAYKDTKKRYYINNKKKLSTLEKLKKNLKKQINKYNKVA